MEDEQRTSQEISQTELMKKQLFYSRITCFAIVIFLLIFAGVLVPRTVRILHNLNEITTELNQVDIKGLESDVKENLGKISDSLDDLDTDTLNHAIGELDQVAETLSQAVQPLTNFYRGRN